MTSSNYFDLAVGYQFNRVGIFVATSFRNPSFETEGFQAKQQIQKNSLNLEVCKFLTDYSGFAPFVGVNLAFDHLNYKEFGEQLSRKEISTSWQAGLTFGWDIIPGKTDETFILRTNLRWYPFASLEIDGQAFAFDQLEYNLIQAIFFPSRLARKKK